MNLKNYKRIDRRHIAPYPVYLVTPPYAIFNRDHIHTKFETFVMVFEDGMWNGVIHLPWYNEGKKKTFELYQKNPKIIDKFTKKLDKKSRKFLKFSKTFVNKDYSKSSNNELLELYKRYNKEYIESYVYGEPFAQLLKDYLGDDLKERLLEILKDEKKLNEIFSFLITPAKDNFIKKEEKDLVKIALKKKSIKALEKHTKKYNWIQVDYNSPALTIKHFENELKEIRNPKEKLKELRNKNKEIRKKQLEIKKEYGIDKKTFKLCLATQKAVYLMELKRGRYSEAHYHVQFLMTEIGKRLGLDLRRANYLTPAEVEEYLIKNKKFDKKVLDDRYKQSVYLSEEKSLTVADKKLEKEIINYLDKNKKKTSELKGICGNPGKVKGKVRVIVKAKDFPKFKQGEILVTAFTTPDFVIIMKKAKGIVTDYGGITSHASIVARELNVPCLVGTEHATHLFKDGDLIELDAEKGTVKKVK